MSAVRKIERISREDLRDRLKEAARTLRALPLTSRDFPQDVRSAWPEISREVADQFAAEVGATPNEVREMRSDRLRIRLCPSTAEIARLDEALIWLGWIHGRERMVLIARAQGFRTGILARVLHCSRRTILNIETSALDKISEKIFAQVARFGL